MQERQQAKGKKVRKKNSMKPGNKLCKKNSKELGQELRKKFIKEVGKRVQKKPEGIRQDCMLKSSKVLSKKRCQKSNK